MISRSSMRPDAGCVRDEVGHNRSAAAPEFPRSFSGQDRANYGPEAGTDARRVADSSKLSEYPAQAGGLWIRRVLVRAQEGQYGRRKRGRFYCGLGLRREPRQCNEAGKA